MKHTVQGLSLLRFIKSFFNNDNNWKSELLTVKRIATFDNDQKLTVCFLEPDLLSHPQNKELFAITLAFRLLNGVFSEAVTFHATFHSRDTLTLMSHVTQKSSGCLLCDKSRTYSTTSEVTLYGVLY